MRKAPRCRLAPATLRTRVRIALILVAGFALSPPPLLRAQASLEDGSVQSARKVLTRVTPEYPKLLKVTRIGGVVKLNATVLPNGTVAKVTVLGGNPVLAEEAVRAVMRWKFAAASTQSNEIVSFTFNAH